MDLDTVYTSVLYCTVLRRYTQSLSKVVLFPGQWAVLLRGEIGVKESIERTNTHDDLLNQNELHKVESIKSYLEGGPGTFLEMSPKNKSLP